MEIFASHPYDVAKLLFRIGLGAENRPTIKSFDTLANTIVISFGQDTEEVKLICDKLNYDYINDVFNDENGVFELDEYGKVFYEMGSVSLINILFAVLDFKKYLGEINIEKYPQFVLEYDDEFNKINNSLSILYKNFINKVNLLKIYDSNITLGYDTIYGIITKYEQMRASYKLDSVSNADILLGIYNSFLFIIIGLVSIISVKACIPSETIFVDSFDGDRAVDIIKAIADSNVTEGDSKIKLFTMSMIFFAMNRFYRIYSGVAYNDPLINIAANIGYGISLSIKNEDDFKFIDQEMVDGIHGTKASVIGFTSKYDALRNFINYRESFAIKNDFSVPWVIATPFFQALRDPTEASDTDASYLDDIVDSYTPLINKYIDSNLSIKSYSKADDLSIARSFNFLKDCISGVEKEVVMTVDPFVFYQITLIVSTYRKIKSDDIYKSLDDDKKKKVDMGIIIGDCLLYTLYNQWFLSGKFYNQSKRPLYSENKIQSTLDVLKKEVDVVIYTYLENICYNAAGDSEEMKQTLKDYYTRTNFLYTRDVSIINPSIITGIYTRPVDQYPSDIRDNANSILYSIVSQDIDKNFNFNTIIKNIADVLDFKNNKVSASVMKLVAKADSSEKIFDDELLDRIYSIISDIGNIGEKEFMFLTYVPILEYIDKCFNENNIGQYFDFVSPDQMNNSYNFEYLLNEEVRTPLSDAITSQEAFNIF